MRRSAGGPLRDWHRLLPWLVGVFVAQAAYVLTRDGASVGALPIGTAQGSLLQDIYNLSVRWEALGWLGFWRGLPDSGDHPSAATVLASLVEIYGGGGRMALLLPGLTLLLVSELAFATAALRLTRSPALAAVGLGLLSLRTRPWLAATGLFSVNTEWLACGTFGLAMSLMVAPSPRRSVATMIACGALGIATLCFSSTAFACLLVVAALRVVTRQRAGAPSAAVAVTAVVLLLAAAGLLWVAAVCPPVPDSAISLEQDKVAQCGYGLRTSVLYWASFDLGLPFVFAAGAALIAAITATILRRSAKASLRQSPRLRTESIFLTAVLMALACIQVGQRSANPIGSGLVDVPLTALLLAGMAALLRRLDIASPQPARLACFGFLSLCLVLPWGTPILDVPAPRPSSVTAGIASWLLHDAEVNERSRARILVAPPLAGLDGPSLSALFFETFGEPAAFTVTAPSGDPDAPPAFDYAVLPTTAESDVAASALLHRVEAGMVRRVELDSQGLSVTIFSTPQIALAGVSGGWLLATGTTLRFDAGEIPRDKAVVLTGPDGYVRYTPIAPSVTAVATERQGTTLSLPARFVREGNSYAIYIDPAPVALSGGGRVEVAVDFSRFFVPKDVGLNLDERRLAVVAPTSIGLADRAKAFDGAEATP